MRPHTPCTNSSNAPLAAPLDHPTHIAGTRTFHRFHHNHHTPLTFSIGHFSGAATARCSQLYPFLGPLPTPWLLRTLRPLPPLPRSILCAPARRTANAWRGIGARRLAAAANTPTPSARALTLTLTPRPTRWRCLLTKHWGIGPERCEQSEHVRRQHSTKDVTKKTTDHN